MSNELEIQVNNALDIKALAQQKENSYIKMLVKRKDIPNGKTTFPSIKAYMYLPCYDIDGNYEGKFGRWIDVHFLTTTFDKNKSVEGSNVSNISDIVSGDLYVYAKFVQKPSRYQVTYEKNDDGEIVLNKKGEPVKVYPEIWIKGGIIGNIPYIATQDDFNRPNDVTNEKVIDVKVDDETGEVLEG